jgi:hypothetical protein
VSCVTAAREGLRHIRGRQNCCPIYGDD